MDEKLVSIVKLLDDKLAQNIVTLDMKNVSPYFDYFVILTVDNQRLANALVSYVEDLCDLNHYEIKSISDGNESGWILIDLNDIIIHIFNQETRNHYNLEKLYSDCPVVEIR